MKSKQLLSTLALGLFMAAAPAVAPLPLAPVDVAQAQEARVSFSIFFEDLRPHGIWVRHAKYKYVFCPKVDVRWRPYTNGHWIWLRDRGWYFDSDEPFAWAVYHYGRWIDDDRLGWCWVPGNRWAPAWVAWRRSDRHVGWAPLPPEDDGFQIRIEVSIGEPPRDDWVFVPVVNFVEVNIINVIIFEDEEPDLIAETEFVGPVKVENNVVINNNIDITFIEQQTNIDVKEVEAQNVDQPEKATAEVQGDTIQVFAPTIEEPKEEEAPAEAVEPEQAVQELGRPAEGEAAPAEQAAPPAEGEAAPAEEAAPPAEVAPQDGQCPEGYQLVDGKCVLIATEEQQAPAEEQAPAEQAPAEEAAPAEGAPADQAPAEEAAPTEEQAPAAEEPIQCPEGQQLVDGKCVPIAPPEEQEAPAEEEAVPAEEEAAPPAEEQAPAEEAAPSEEAGPPAEVAPQDGVCPEGYQLVEGKCLLIQQ